ncbi:MAG: hypothetical protein JW863_20725 [Chitinispirillaceae bacterium]|nr:hypothetical protein [Chitinispirillaceae bacterium]
MHPFKRTSDLSGTTLLELIIGLLITSILVAGAFQAYRYTMDSANREKKKAELQGDIITFSNIIEKDIRMAGCGMPGNGLYADYSVPELMIFTNENGDETTLSRVVQPIHAEAIVEDGSAFVVRGGICIAADGVDTIYRKVTGIGMYDLGPDTVYFSPAANTSTLMPAGSKVYPAMCFRYTVSGTLPDRKILRSRNSQTVPIGGIIDSIRVTLKDEDGSPTGGATKNAAMMTVVMGGFIGKGGNRVFLADSTEVNLRNRK